MTIAYRLAAEDAVNDEELRQVTQRLRTAGLIR
jgi:hypothetical protein